MPRTVRLLSIAFLFGAALFAAGCTKSNNTGKIEGKWKITGLPANATAEDVEEFAEMEKLGVFVYFEFRPLGSMVIGVGSADPALLEQMKAALPGGKTVFNAKYKLLSGDGIEIYDMDPEVRQFMKGARGRTNVTINGDEMVMQDPDGSTGKLTRVKETAGNDPAAKPAPEKK